MRARGAKVTDIVVLVVAADDGVMPQTVEAIHHAVRRGCDRRRREQDRQARRTADKVMQELLQHEVVPEEWGGDTQVVKVSAKTGVGIDALLDAILIQSELLELMAPSRVRHARDHRVEPRPRARAGATILVQSGTLQRGDVIVTGSSTGACAPCSTSRAAGEVGRPSIPVQVLGLSGAPNAGDEVVVIDDERRARELAELRRDRFRDTKLAAQKTAKLDDLFSQMAAARRRSSTSSSRPTSRAPWRPCATRWRSARPTRSRCGSSHRVSAVSPSRTPTSRSLERDRRGLQRPRDAAARGSWRRRVSTCATTASSTRSSTTLRSPVRHALAGGQGADHRLAEVRDVFRSAKLGAVAGCMVVDAW